MLIYIKKRKKCVSRTIVQNAPTEISEKYIDFLTGKHGNYYSITLGPTQPDKSRLAFLQDITRISKKIKGVSHMQHMEHHCGLHNLLSSKLEDFANLLIEGLCTLRYSSMPAGAGSRLARTYIHYPVWSFSLLKKGVEVFVSKQTVFSLPVFLSNNGRL